MVVFISPELEHVVLALRPPGSPLHIIRRPLNSMLVAQVHCPKGNQFSAIELKFSGENVILRGIFHVVYRFPLHFMLYLERKLLF